LKHRSPMGALSTSLSNDLQHQYERV